MGEVVSGDGTGFDNPVILKNISDNDDLKNTEYSFISSKFGEPDKDWKIKSQALQPKDNKLFDVLTITLNSGEEHTLYFDITDFSKNMLDSL